MRFKISNLMRNLFFIFVLILEYNSFKLILNLLININFNFMLFFSGVVRKLC